MLWCRWMYEWMSTCWRFSLQQKVFSLYWYEMLMNCWNANPNCTLKYTMADVELINCHFNTIWPVDLLERRNAEQIISRSASVLFCYFWEREIIYERPQVDSGNTGKNLEYILAVDLKLGGLVCSTCWMKFFLLKCNACNLFLFNKVSRETLTRGWSHIISIGCDIMLKELDPHYQWQQC